MSIECFLYGLTAFAMALVVLLRGRRSSQLALGKQFWWLGASGLLSSFYSWSTIFLTDNPYALSEDVIAAIRIVLLVASGIALLRFGAGLILNADPLPPWLALVSNTLMIPATLVIAYAIIAVATAANHEISAAQWVRYLIIFPGNVAAAVGFVLQWKRLRHTPYTPLMLAATGAAFLLNAFFTGAVTGTVGLTDAMIEGATQVPVQVWRVGTMALVALLVSGSMSVFEVERKQEITRLQAARRTAQNTARAIRATSQHESEVWLDALVKISRRIANMEDADAVLSELVSLARELVHADLAALALNEVGTRLCLRYVATVDGVEMPKSNTAIDNVIVRGTIDTGSARRFPEDGGGIDFTWQVADHVVRTPTAAIVPLKLNQTTIGALWAGRYTSTSFSCVDLIGLSHLANQAVITLEHVSMAGRLQSLAVMEERSRIAREMHDSLAQILGYLSLETQTLEALARQHDEQAVLAELAQARATIRSAQADVRENILSLRTTLSGEAGFVTALTEYVEEFGIQTGIQTCVQPTDDVALSPLVETQAVRIVQEALTNVRKHAKAAHVRVTMQADAGWLKISVVDDGVGMPENPSTDHHFGLLTMHERAESIGGSLAFKSSPGMGTTVELRLPLANEGG